MKNEQDKNKEKLTVLNAELPLLENKEFTYYEIEELEDITELKQEFEVLETKKSLYEERSKIYDSYLEKKENYEKAQENIKNLDKDIKDNTNELNDLELKDLPDYDSDKYSNLKIELNDVETNISNWYNKKEQALKVEKEINKLNSELNEIKSSLEKNRLFRVKTLSFTDDEFKKVENQLDYDKIEMHKYTDGANAIHKAECPILEQPCDRIKDEYERFIEERDKYNDKVNKGIKQLEQWKKDKEEYNNSKNNLDKIKIKRDQLLKDKEDKFSRLNELTKTEIVVDEKNLNELTDKKCKIEIDLDKLDKLKIEYDTIKSYNSNLVELRLRKELDIAQLEGQVKELEKIEEPEEIKPPEEFNLNKYETVKKEINIYDQKIIEIEKLNKMNEETKEKEKQNKKDIKDKKKKIENLEKRNRALEQARTFLDKKFSAYMVTKGTTKIKNKMNEFFQGAYGKYEVTFMQDKNSVEFFYTENGQYPKSVVMSSGHEKKVLAVSNRIALCSLQSLGIMLLDEIDSDCNTDKSIKLFDKLLNEKFNQLFIITHNYETQEFIRNQWGCGLFEIKQGTII